CLMEGVASEASSLAGHLQLNNLIAFWDDNKISIDGSTEVAFTEDVLKRYEAYGWDTLTIEKGDTDLEGVAQAIKTAKASKKPTLIRLTTIIGYGSLQQGTHGVHGAPLKPDDIKQLKEKFGFDPTKSFVVPQEVYDYYGTLVKKNQELESEWNKTVESYIQKFPEEGAVLARRLKGELPEDWAKCLPTYTADDKPLATRKLSEMALTKILDVVPE
ncbi:hypothetical protein OXX69_012909, partial [Metschnikowia pulcherrima]